MSTNEIKGSLKPFFIGGKTINEYYKNMSEVERKVFLAFSDGKGKFLYSNQVNEDFLHFAFLSVGNKQPKPIVEEIPTQNPLHIASFGKKHFLMSNDMFSKIIMSNTMKRMKMTFVTKGGSSNAVIFNLEITNPVKYYLAALKLWEPEIKKSITSFFVKNMNNLIVKCSPLKGLRWPLTPSEFTDVNFINNVDDSENYSDIIIGYFLNKLRFTEESFSFMVLFDWFKIYLLHQLNIQFKTGQTTFKNIFLSISHQSSLSLYN